MHTELSFKEIKAEWHGSMRSYVIGFFSSIILTLISFGLVYFKGLEGTGLVLTIVGLALVQAFVQLRFFLHVGQEDKPKWETLVFYFMILILFIIVVGSIWIMHDLNVRVMGSMMETPTTQVPHD